MKKITLLLILAFGIKTAFASCAPPEMGFYPFQKEISLNSMFIITGNSNHQNIMYSFETRTVYLEDQNGALIELNLEAFLEGGSNLTQAVFCLATELQPNSTYHLKYSAQTEEETKAMIKWNANKKVREKIYWTTTDKESTGSLNPNLTIEFDSRIDSYYRGRYAIYNIKTQSKFNSNAEIWYKTEVLDLESDIKRTFYLLGSKEQLYVGNGYCGGFFSIVGKRKVRFTPMDIDGIALKTTDWKSMRRWSFFGN